MFHFKILFAIIFILISDEIFKLSHVIFVIQLISSFQENTKCESTFFADTCTLCVPIFKLGIGEDIDFSASVGRYYLAFLLLKAHT